MGVQFKNNANSTLASAIANSDLGVTVATGEGALFPALGVGDYFYMTLEATDGAYEVVKVTARSGDNMTVVRAQESTSAFAFSAGTLCELRVTTQGLTDKFAEDSIGANSVDLGDIETIAAARVLGSVAGGDVSELSASTVLDLVGSTQGQVLYRGASSWAALSPGTSGQLLKANGAGANPSWVTGIFLTDGDKGDITVSSSGAAFTIDNAAVSLAKMANVNQYAVFMRTSSGAGVPQTIASSADVAALLVAANDAAFRTELGLGSLATQASSAVAITGGTIGSLTELQGTMKLATNTTGTLQLADANCFVPMTGNITFDGNVFSARQAWLLYSGASSRTVTEGTSMTLRLGGSATTGNRSLAARTLAVAVAISATEVVIVGQGVT